MNIFTAVGKTLESLVSIITSVSRTTEDTVLLVEKEVLNLHELQDSRFNSEDEGKATRIQSKLNAAIGEEITPPATAAA